MSDRVYEVTLINCPGRAGSKHVRIHDCMYSAEAKAQAEAMYGGRAISCSNVYHTKNNSDSSDDGEGTSFSEIAVLGGIILGAWVLITFWPIILGLGVVALIYWIYTALKD